MTVRGFNDMWVPAQTHGVANGAANQDDIASGPCVLMGYVLSSATNDAGSTITGIAINFDNALTAGSGTLIKVKRIVEEDTVQEWFGPQGVRFSTGLSLDLDPDSGNQHDNIRRLSIFYIPDA